MTEQELAAVALKAIGNIVSVLWFWSQEERMYNNNNNNNNNKNEKNTNFFV